jgi:hypothetical protein
MPIITLTSDWGLRDHYIAASKGYLLSRCADARIIDISHDIPVFDLKRASFVIRNAYHYFPEGSIHILAVLSEVSPETPHVLISYKGHYFIGADNGIFSLIFDEEPDEIIEIDLMQERDYFTFPSMDIFMQAACLLLSGKKPEELGDRKEKLNPCVLVKPVLSGNILKGNIIYIDRYENVVVNISHEYFNQCRQNKKYSIQFSGGRYSIERLSTSYHDVPDGEKLALFGSHGFLEIAINKGNAASLMGLEYDDIVRIEFYS